MVAYNLPHAVTPFVGRLTELAEIADRLSDPNCRLLTLIGPGGIGKTRLAIQAMMQNAGRFADGVYFVPLQPLHSPDFMVPTIADAVRLQFYPGGDPQKQLLDYFREKMLLLVLDNIEQLSDGAGLLSEILHTAPRVRILATSRERLNLLEEWGFEVRELYYPADETVTDIESYDAVQLFLLHAHRVQASFTLTPQEKPAVIHICRLVGGMPLGIELAAAWMRALSLEEIVQEIERSLDILETPARNIEPRHRNIRAAFEPMWTQLSEKERIVFKKLALFRGGFTREAAQQVAGAALSALSALVDRSLVRMHHDGRYDLHELLRQYAEERLRETAGELEEVREQHGLFFAAFLAQKQTVLEGRGQKAAFKEIEREIDNIRAAWQWALAHKREVEIAKACHAIWYFYDTRGWYQEGEQAFQTAAEALGINDTGEDKSAVLGKVMACYGGFCFSLNRADKARQLLEKSLTILRRQQATSEIAYALLRLSEVAIFLENDLFSAQNYLQESLMLCRKLDHQWGTAYSLRWLGFIEMLREAYQEAQQLAQESLVLYENSGDTLGKVSALIVVSFSALGLGNYERAQQLSREIWILCNEIGLRHPLSIAQIMLGAALCGLGNYAEAKHHLYEGLSEACKVHFMPYILLGVLETAHWLIATGSTVKALPILSFLLAHPVPPVRGIGPVRRLFAKLQREVSADIFTMAVNQGKSLDRETVIQTCTDILRPSADSARTLNERELEILLLVAQGFSNREIAQQLILSLGTVKWYMHQIYSKLAVGSRTQAIARARELKLLL